MNNKQKMSRLFQTPIPPWICVPLYISCLHQHSYAEKIDWNKTNKKGQECSWIKSGTSIFVCIVVNALLSSYSAPVKSNCSGDELSCTGKSRVFLHPAFPHAFPGWWIYHGASVFFFFLSCKIEIIMPFLLLVAPSDLWINHSKWERSIFKDLSVTSMNHVNL